jgi:hypothetical protein
LDLGYLLEIKTEGVGNALKTLLFKIIQLD